MKFNIKSSIFLTTFVLLFLLTAQSANASLRIVNGSKSDISKWPALGAIFDNRAAPANNGHFCSGTLITPRIVLTASHCLDAINTNHTDIIFRRTDLRFKKGISRAIVKKISHPQFSDKNLAYDFGLLYLNAPVSGIKPLKIYNSKIPTLTSLLTAGWGIDNSGSSSNILRQLSIQTQKWASCQRVYENLARSSFCATGRSGGDTCTGDSGGPALFRNQIVGIVSWGRGCGKKGFPGVYGDISFAADWINSVLKKNSFIKKSRQPGKEYSYYPFNALPLINFSKDNIRHGDTYFYDLSVDFYLKEPVKLAQMYFEKDNRICVLYSGECLTGWVNLNYDGKEPGGGYVLNISGSVLKSCFSSSVRFIFQDKRFIAHVQKLTFCLKNQE